MSAIDALDLHYASFLTWNTTLQPKPQTAREGRREGRLVFGSSTVRKSPDARHNASESRI